MFVVNLWYFAEVFVLSICVVIFPIAVTKCLRRNPMREEFILPSSLRQVWDAAHTESPLGRGEEWRGLWLAGLKALPQ